MEIMSQEEVSDLDRGLGRRLGLASDHALLELIDLAQRGVQVVLVRDAEDQLSDEGGLGVLEEVTSSGTRRRFEGDSKVIIGLGGVLDGLDMKRHQMAIDGEEDRLSAIVNVDL